MPIHNIVFISMSINIILNSDMRFLHLKIVSFSSSILYYYVLPVLVSFCPHSYLRDDTMKNICRPPSRSIDYSQDKSTKEIIITLLFKEM